MGKKKTLTEMEEKVKEGLRIARESVDDQELLKLCDDLEYTWDNLCANLIIVGVGLSAMRYRTPNRSVNNSRSTRSLSKRPKINV